MTDITQPNDLPQTDVASDHFHTISDPESNKTDLALDKHGRAHYHYLTPSCPGCAAMRKYMLHLGKTHTTYNRLHSHQYTPVELLIDDIMDDDTPTST